MCSPSWRIGPASLLLLTVSIWASLGSTLALNLCASLNTGETPRNNSIYQTNGLCHDFCMQEYAFAITQYNSCWCSNYYPDLEDQVDQSKCSKPCPAFPDEHCGGPNVFGYVIISGNLPSGTEKASTATRTSTTQISQETTSTKTTTESATHKTSAPSTTVPPLISVVQTVTVGGEIKTVIVRPTVVSTTSGDNSPSSVENSGLSTGSVVGIVVGVIGAVLIIAGVLVFFYLRRRKARAQAEEFQNDPSARGGSASGSNHPDMSMLGGLVSSPDSVGNRSSILQIDPRMDPFRQGLYGRSASQESLHTLRDEHDYSRRIQPPNVLRATNPDPVSDA